ncbi:hypothetical protein PoB_007013000 [Plakobranchus ocellatus]|uniref:Uncharacterized protein n=1 Tax=Plakobranchus ocellatus TaxID=259542 RepID=A0AAV4DI27_9GAST|nr:hypothetical protein PoB_007013000 [Plakobranchus ocellatus]
MISGFEALRQARAPWRGSKPQPKDTCRSQGGFAIHCATDVPTEVTFPVDLFCAITVSSPRITRKSSLKQPIAWILSTSVRSMAISGFQAPAWQGCC